MKSYRSPQYLVGSVSRGADDRGDLAHRRLRLAILTGSAFFLLGAILLAGKFAAAMGGNPTAILNTAPTFEPSPSALPMVPQFGLERSRDHVRLKWLRGRHAARESGGPLALGAIRAIRRVRAPVRWILFSQCLEFGRRRGLRVAVSRRAHGVLLDAGGFG